MMQISINMGREDASVQISIDNVYESSLAFFFSTNIPTSEACLVGIGIE